MFFLCASLNALFFAVHHSSLSYRMIQFMAVERDKVCVSYYISVAVFYSAFEACGSDIFREKNETGVKNGRNVTERCRLHKHLKKRAVITLWYKLHFDFELNVRLFAFK